MSVSFLRDFGAASEAAQASSDTPAPPPLLLGFTGPAGAGKDTAAAYLEEQYAFQTVALADPLRDMLGALLQHVDVDGAWMVERALKELPVNVLGLSYRHLAQTLGTEWGRALRPDLWLRIAEYRVHRILEGGDNAVITDVRFPNEAAWLAAAGGRLVRLTREQVPTVRAHESEAHHAQLPVWREIRNDSTKAHLFDQLDTVVEAMRAERGSA